MKRLWNRDHVTIASTGSANAYVLTYGTAPASYINGGRYAFRANFANTGSATANVNGLGAKTINQHGGSGLAVLAGNEIQIAHHVTLEYDSTADVLVIVSPTPATSGSLGTMSTQNANAVAITGGTITGITDLAVADGGMGRSTLTAHGVLIGNGTNGVNATTAGTAGQALISNGAAADPTFQSFSGIVTVTSQIFTASGTYTPATGMLYCDVVCIGGGGGGGGAVTTNTTQLSGGGGGGAGGYSRARLTAAQIGASKAVTIGTSGAGGNGGGSAPTAGGDTSLGVLCVGKGGSASSNGTTTSGTAGGAGGVAGTGDVALVGAKGSSGCGCTTTASTGFAMGGAGGPTMFGNGGGVSSTNGQATGTSAPVNSGGGGGGGCSGFSGSNVAGGAGGTGIVIITEYNSQ